MHLYLTESAYNYKLDPTPESIALVDYFLENAIFDGASYDLFLEPNLLYIDDVNVTFISASAPNGIPESDYVHWYDSKSYFRMAAKTICWRDEFYPKGTILVEDYD